MNKEYSETQNSTGFAKKSTGFAKITSFRTGFAKKRTGFAKSGKIRAKTVFFFFCESSRKVLVNQCFCGPTTGCRELYNWFRKMLQYLSFVLGSQMVGKLPACKRNFSAFSARNAKPGWNAVHASSTLEEWSEVLNYHAHTGAVIVKDRTSSFIRQESFSSCTHLLGVTWSLLGLLHVVCALIFRLNAPSWREHWS